MSEASKMPARIWTGPELVAATHTWGAHEYSEGGKASVAYIRADIAEQMAEALRRCAAVCAGETMNKLGLIGALEKACAALSAWEASNPAILKARQASSTTHQSEAQRNDQ